MWGFYGLPFHALSRYLFSVSSCPFFAFSFNFKLYSYILCLSIFAFSIVWRARIDKKLLLMTNLRRFLFDSIQFLPQPLPALSRPIPIYRLKLCNLGVVFTAFCTLFKTSAVFYFLMLKNTKILCIDWCHRWGHMGLQIPPDCAGIMRCSICNSCDWKTLASHD